MIRTTNKSDRKKLMISDLTVDPSTARDLTAEELVIVAGGRAPDSGYICSAPSNDCSKD